MTGDQLLTACLPVAKSEKYNRGYAYQQTNTSRVIDLFILPHTDRTGSWRQLVSSLLHDLIPSPSSKPCDFLDAMVVHRALPLRARGREGERAVEYQAASVMKW